MLSGGGAPRAALWLVRVVAGLAFVALVAEAYGRDDAQDLEPVWRAAHAFVQGDPPYAERGFLYPPSALLILAPLGGIGFDEARAVVTLLTAGMVLTTAALCVVLCDVPPRSPAATLIVSAIALSAPVVTTLHLGNVNAFVAAGELAALLAAARGRWAASGWILGPTLALKPVLAPLALLGPLWRRPGAAMRAVAVPVLLCLIALPLTVSGGDFLTDTVPFLFQGNDEDLQKFNVSLAGLGAVAGLPSPVSAMLRVVVLLAGARLLLRRLSIGADDVARLLDCAGILLLVTFLTFTISFNYYAMYLAPVLVLAVLGRSALPRWTATVAIVLVASPDVSWWRSAGDTGHQLASARITAGLALMLVGFAVSVRTAPAAAARC